jgi:hypothetical protein
MSKFELSDKELKQLLQNEGLEEPSMSFNRMILEKAQAFEQTRSIKTPLALKIAFGVLMLIPPILIFVAGGVDLGLAETIKEQQISIPSPSLDFQVNSYYFYFLALTVGVIWLSVFFNKVLSNQK